MQKSTEDAIEGEVTIDFTLQTKPQSDDESTINPNNFNNSNNSNNQNISGKVVPISSSVAPKNAGNQEVSSPLLQKDLKELKEQKPEPPAPESTGNPANPSKIQEDRLMIADNGFLMLPDSHPDYLSLINLQIENQELLNWKKQLQFRINAERNEIVRLNRLLTTSQQVVEAAPVDESEYEKLVAHFLKENEMLERKRELLANEIFEENKSLIKLRCQETLLEYSH